MKNTAQPQAKAQASLVRGTLSATGAHTETATPW